MIPATGVRRIGGFIPERTEFREKGSVDVVTVFMVKRKTTWGALCSSS